MHRAKKSGGRLRAGQALRGSSEFHAWGDSNLYLRRDGATLTLTVEHRAAASTPAIDLEFVSHNDALALLVLTSAPCVSPTVTSIDERITAALIEGAADWQLVGMLADLAYEVFLETGILIQPVPVSLAHWRHPEGFARPGYLRNVAREGIVIGR